MKVNLTTVLKTLKGEAMTNKDGSPFTLRDVLIEGLLYENADGRVPDLHRKPTSTQKIRAWVLGQEMIKSDTVDLTSEDIVFIKDGIDKLYNSTVYGQVDQLLEDKQ